MICQDCGGNRTTEKCNLCELFQQGTHFYVEKERLNNPKYSDALGVHPDQVQEATADAKHKGVPTEFLADGRAVIRSRAHQKAYLKAYKMFNRDASYGD